MRTSSATDCVFIFFMTRARWISTVRGLKTQVLGDGLVLLASCHVVEHLTFARRERLEMCLDARMLTE